MEVIPVVNLDEELDAIDAMIAGLNFELTRLIDRKYELLAQSGNAKVQDIIDYIAANGIAPH